MKINKLLCMIIALVFCFASVGALSACKGEEEQSENAGASSPFCVVYKGITIQLDKSADNVLEKLGKAKYEDNLGDCGGIGVQMKYTYDDITVNTLKEQGGEVIHKIAFVNDLVETPKGISIGSSEAEVKSAYGEPSSTDGGKLLYKSGDLELEFSIKDGSVSAVNYRRVR